MKTLWLVMLSFILIGCAHERFYWQKKEWAKTNIDEAHNDCTVKASIAVGNQRSPYDWGYAGRLNSFMQECMSGQGYALIKEIPEPQIRATSSIRAQKEINPSWTDSSGP